MIRGNNLEGDSFIRERCQIFGRYGDKIYQRMRNGQQRIYDYCYKPKYAATELSRRSDCVARAASLVSNPQYKGYKSVINKLYYYTPYFLHAGTFHFTCNTFLKLRIRGSYTLGINGVRIGMNLAPRTKIELSFEAGNTYQVTCYKNGQIYSERNVIVIPAGQTIEEAYGEWFNEFLGEILHLPEPTFASLTLYRRGIVPPDIYETLSGKTPDGVLYRSGRAKFSYVRSSYIHPRTANGDHYYNSQRSVTNCWKNASDQFKFAWKKYHQLWIVAELSRTNKATKSNNLWSSAVFRAAAETGEDPEGLTPENFIPGVETLGELLDAAYLGGYGLDEADLKTKIFND